ncbi:zinc finger HIT domain-containing protein 2 [Sphaeramia orbicularis]|uniref:HIT-type domain-containing protein n=1 Tax=Sphaeramia orbicularis TaxID=375764 RepID=A0A673BAS4_9TELE|nr:zinc finger HIT domain-containing protein 2 [Sphaeramia orbicularis]XP_030012621.1 zinc finger HIT domain-containing protein 2 [Sphaeramia orbicularis]
MNPVFRRRLPPSVRSLLTDIGPKEEWIDTEPDPVTRDGIVLPSRGGEEGLLTPAGVQETETTDNSRSSTVCMLCKSKPSRYTCPRCNLPYCGLACYQSPDHSVCSEEFYKESVLQELKEMGKTEAEGRKKMQEILVGLRQKAEGTYGGMESLLREEGVLSDESEGEEGEVKEKVQVVELLSRLAELQQSGEEDVTEIETILRQLEKIGGGQDEENELLGGDDQPDEAIGEVDLAERLSGLDLDTLSEEELWELLNNKEKEKFMSLMKDGAFGGLVPLWKPWWEEHDEGSRELVEVLEEEMNKLERGPSSNMDEKDNDSELKILPAVAPDQPARKVKKTKSGNRKEKSNCIQDSAVSGVPAISAKIPKLSSLCPNPSPLVGFSLVNALFGYAFTLCLLNGDTDSLMFELCDMILALSEALNSNRVFNSIQEALDCGETAVLSGGYFDKDNLHAPARAVEAVAHIMTGRSRKDASGYCLSALSQLRSVLSQARAALSKEGEEGKKRQKYFLASKKCEFFQAWVLESGHNIHIMAIELWNEHSKREHERTTMEKAKIVVEESIKKDKRKADSKLIQEVN